MSILCIANEYDMEAPKKKVKRAAPASRVFASWASRVWTSSGLKARHRMYTIRFRILEIT